MGDSSEQAVVFPSRGQRLLGILHTATRSESRLGVLVVVGGPQYRVGSHRQFVLLARDLAANGIPTFRFDVRGMGDSGGEPVTFEYLAPDISAAVDQFTTITGVSEVVLWGLCDGASAALMYAPMDPRIAGLVLLNPWVRSEEGLAKSYLRTYYPRRLVSGAFWRKALREPATVFRAVLGLLDTLRRSNGSDAPAMPDFRAQMLVALERFRGPVVILLSGRDITAGEFRALARSSPAWRRTLARRTIRQHELSEANHTFSSHEWRSWVAERTVDAVRRLETTQ